MREHVSIDVLANWVVMLRAGVEGAILLADDDEDARFYEICCHEEARVVPASDVAISLLERMHERGVHGVAAAVRGSAVLRKAPNVFRPSVGDTTSLLLLSKGCEKVLRDVGGNAWMVACEKEVNSIRLRAVSIARVIFRIREFCVQHSIAFPGGLDPREAVDWKSFEMHWGHVGQILADAGLERPAIKQLTNIRPEPDLRSALLECDGMDVVRVLSAATRMYRPRGIQASKEVDPESLVGMLRVAFDIPEFEGDEIYWRMRLWERCNTRYPLLRQWRILEPLGVVWDQRYWQGDLVAMLATLQSAELLAMFKMDLDGFKAVNEEVGHAGGDDAIRVYCQAVKDVLGTVGEVYRRGGDEVVALAPGITEGVALELAEKVRSTIESSLREWGVGRGLGFSPTVSIGLAIATSTKTSSELTKLADEAQSEAKRTGKNRVVVVNC